MRYDDGDLVKNTHNSTIEAQEVPAPPPSARDSARLPDDQASEIVERTARRVVELLQAAGSVANPKHADANNNPLGSSRAFLDAHRRRDFKTFKRGREIVAIWTDVERFIESRPAAPRPVTTTEPTPSDVDIGALLARRTR